MIDLHMHTARCGHATGTIDEYVEAARVAGLEVMCFTDHLPMPATYPQHYTMCSTELDAYVKDVAVAAALSAETGGPEVLCGIEADWLAGDSDHIRTAVAAHDFDMVLGSVHFIGDWAFDDPDLTARYSSTDIDALWDRYFALVFDAARSGLFDVLAHPDLIKKFGFMPGVDPGSWYEETALALFEGGCAVEVNAAGLRKPVGEIYPSLPLLRACRRRGVPATFGSDAHAPQEVAAGVGPARDLLAQAGYDSLVVFRRRTPFEVAL
jgi:histidinol-phosphatase (PHP family)